MRVVTCPHCGHRRILTNSVPQDVMVVLPCTSCKEYLALFRTKVLGLDRQIIEHGTRAQRREHLANVLARFIEPGFFDQNDIVLHDGETGDVESPQFEETADAVQHASELLISDEEIDDFLTHELEEIDDPLLFHKRFG